MIKINLIDQQVFKMPTIAGIRLDQIGYQYFIIALVIGMVSNVLVKGYFQKKEEFIRQDIVAKQDELKKVNDDFARLEGLKKVNEELNKRTAELENRLKGLSRVVKIRNTPTLILEAVAKASLDDLWISTLDINEDKSIKILGTSRDYKSIGTFLDNLNQNNIFGGSLRLSNSVTRESNKSDNKIRLEDFEIAGVASNYEIF